MTPQAIPASLSLLRKLPLPKKLGLLEKLYGSTLSTYGTQWVTCANGVTWKLNLQDPCHRWIVYGLYEGGKGINFAHKQLSQGGVYIDSGANIGQWLLYLGHIQHLTTLAFEPVQSQHDWLESCLKNYSDWDVELLKFGLGCEDATLDIQCDGARSTLNLDWFKTKNLAREKIKIRRLDDLLSERNIDYVNFWKLDVEGAEIQALQGAENAFQHRNIGTLYFECHHNNYAQAKQWLADFGYQLFRLHKTALTPLNDDTITRTTDLIAQPV